MFVVVKLFRPVYEWLCNNVIQVLVHVPVCIYYQEMIVYMLRRFDDKLKIEVYFEVYMYAISIHLEGISSIY